MDDVLQQFPDMPKETVRSSIYRLINKGRVCSIWRNYYVVVPDEYALHGSVPPIEYIDILMRYLGHKYYVGLLNAAAIHGSSHQQPQSFMVVVNSNNIRSKESADVGLRFFAKAHIHDELLLSRNATYGEIKISDPITTALDLILYENRVGGLERAATVVEGLADELDISGSTYAVWAHFPVPVIQRFGYIVESILGYTELGDAIYHKTRDAGITFRKCFLDPGSKDRGDRDLLYEPKWKIIVNTDLEIE